MNRYADIEKGYNERELAIAREAIGEDGLAGIGYGQDYRVALRTARIALRTPAPVEDEPEQDDSTDRHYLPFGIADTEENFDLHLD